MEFVATKKFRETEIRIYRHEGKIWLPAHDVEAALGLKKEAFGVAMHDAAARRPGESIDNARKRADEQALAGWGQEAMLFGRKVKRVRRDKKTGRESVVEELRTNWKLTCEGARRFALLGHRKGGAEMVGWLNRLEKQGVIS